MARTVSVVTTILNEESSIVDLLVALRAQDRKPDEVVIADGGSVDGTVSAINRLAPELPFVVNLICVPGKIGAGRNAAVAAARGEIIAVTDGGCIPSSNWLAELVAPLESGARAAAGAYQADARTPLERAIATFTWVPLTESTRAFSPSHRSVAYERSLWREIGGYDVSLDAGEDTLFNLQVERLSGFAHVPSATVTWRPRTTLKSAIRQQLYYGAGDGRARIQIGYHATIAVFVALELGVLTGKRTIASCGLIAYLAALAYFSRKHVKLFGRIAPDIAALSVLLIVLPAARLCGFVSGWSGGSIRDRS
jgi:glycosyltransferase involved in cell wall biosynthesis